MRKFFTADFHLGSQRVLEESMRPFATADEMTSRLISECNSVAGEDDIVYHVGDMYCYRRDGEYDGTKMPWNITRKLFAATILPLKGNHDENNGVKTVAFSMRMVIGGRFNCVLCHYPSYDKRTAGILIPGDINICGHAHGRWPDKRLFIDAERQVLNINVGVDAWGYKIVSEAALANYITHVIAETMKNQRGFNAKTN